jgi:hypothetical protein
MTPFGNPVNHESEPDDKPQCGNFEDDFTKRITDLVIMRVDGDDGDDGGAGANAEWAKGLSWDWR